jgi:hypothetical protein
MRCPAARHYCAPRHRDSNPDGMPASGDHSDDELLRAIVDFPE